MPQTGGSLDLDVALRAYAPTWDKVSKPLPRKITATNIAKARAATGLDWEPCTEPQFRRVRRGGTDTEPFYEYVEPKMVKGSQERSQFKYVTKGPGGPILDSANDTYNLFGNGEMFEVAEAIGLAGLELRRKVTFVAGGEINGGKKVFLLADLGVRHIEGDPSPHVNLMGLVNGHDGKAALKVIGTDLRWTCTNMIHAAELDARAKGTAFSFRHTSRMASRVEKSLDAIKATMFQLDRVDAVTKELLEVKVGVNTASEYLRQFALARVVSKSNPERAGSAAISHQRARALDSAMFALDTVYASNTCDGIRDTAYGLFAATVEFLDHRRPAATADTLFSRTVLDTQPDKQLSLRILRSVL